MTQIAVVGAGLAGLSLAWKLLDAGNHVTLFEKKEPGAGASGIAAGILSPWKSKTLKKHPLAELGMRASLDLIQKMEALCGKTLCTKQPTLYLCEDKHVDRVAAWAQENNFPWIEPNQAPYHLSYPAAVIDAYQVDTLSYLRALAEQFIQKGGSLVQKEIRSIDELSQYDHVIITSGAWSDQIQGVPISLRKTKGQLIRAEQPLSGPNRVYNVYVLSMNARTWIGGTFENEFTDEKPDPNAASILIEKSAHLGVTITSAWEAVASVRGYGPANMPICMHINPKLSVYCGLGSKGLLTHALYADKMVGLMSTNQVTL